jgi:peptidoglycan hydrolase-like protein with peptidoglycan-binding domain
MFIKKSQGIVLPALCLAALTAYGAPNAQPKQPDCKADPQSKYCQTIKAEPAVPQEPKVAEPVKEKDVFEPKADYNDTRDLQEALVRHCAGLDKSFIDGKAGPYTKNLLIRFQKSYNLIPDGVIGAETIKALNGPVNGKCQAM